MDADVGNRVHPLAGSGIQRAQGVGQFESAQEVLFHVADGVFHTTFFMGLADIAGGRGEAVVSREVEVSWVKSGLLTNGMAEDACL